MTADKPFPDRCIWCLVPDQASDVSHVLPEALGNAGQRILPPGVVCKACNQYYGSKIEPHLLEDPFIHLTAVHLGVMDAGDMDRFRRDFFDARHPPVQPVERRLHTTLSDDGRGLLFHVEYTTSGTIQIPRNRRTAQAISRGLHKVAFEHLAWDVYVNADTYLDPLHEKYHPLRQWCRRGEPGLPVRPVLYRTADDVAGMVGFEAFEFGGEVIARLNLLGHPFTMVLTGTNASALPTLENFSQAEGTEYTVVLGDDGYQISI